MIHQVEDVLESFPALPRSVVSVCGNIVVSNAWEEASGQYGKQALSLLLSYEEDYAPLFYRDLNYVPEKFIFMNEPSVYGKFALHDYFGRFRYLGSPVEFVFSVVIEGRLRPYSGQEPEVLVELYEVESIQIIEDRERGIEKADKIIL